MSLQWTAEMVATVITRPARVTATPALAAWVPAQGGIAAVYRLLRQTPLSPELQSLLEAMLAQPGASVAELCAACAIGRSTFHRYKHQLFETLTVFLTQSVPPASAPPTIMPHTLPHPATSFVGRATERQTLQALVRDPTRRLITLTGTGGTGKTRLSIQVAHDLTPWFPDGIRFLPLADLTEAAQVLPAIAAAFQIDVPAATLLPALSHAIGQHRLVLVLDNLEHVIEAAPDLGALLNAAPTLTILATSRRALRVAGEHVYPVHPLPLASGTTQAGLSDFTSNPAIQLFVQRAQAADPAFSVTPALLAVIGAICDQLDGLPLAIELAAARSTLLPPRLMLTHLKGRLMALGTGPRDAPHRQQTIQATLEWGYQLLSTKERLVLGSLSVFAGSIGLDTVLALHADDTQDGWTADDVLLVIGQLLEQSWLQRQETPSGEVRFAMLHVIREFLRTIHGSDPSWNTWAERYRREIHEVMVQAGAAYRTVDEQRWFTRLEQDLPNVREVLQWHVLHPEVTTGGASIVALVGFWWMRGMRMEGLTWFRKLLDVLPPVLQGSLFHARLLYGIGKLEPKSGTSIPALEASLAIHRTRGPSYAMLETLNWLAYMHGTRGAAAVAIPLYEEALALVSDYGNDLIHIAVVHNLGLIWTDVNEDLATGIRYFREAYAMARVLGNPEYLAMIERSLGGALCAFGAGTEGIPYLEQALRRAREVALTHYVPTLLNSLADAYEAHGRDADCYTLLREGLQVQQHIADMEYLPWTLYLLASLYARTDQPLIAAAMLGVAESMRQDLARLLIRGYHIRVTALTAQLKRTLGEHEWEWASRAWEDWDSITIRATVLALDPPCLERAGHGRPEGGV